MIGRTFGVTRKSDFGLQDSVYMIRQDFTRWSRRYSLGSFIKANFWRKQLLEEELEIL